MHILFKKKRDNNTGEKAGEREAARQEVTAASSLLKI